MKSKREVLLFWKKQLENIGRKGAILVLTKDDEEILSTIAEYVPFFMKKNWYLSLKVMSDDEEIIKRFVCYIDFTCETEIVSVDYFDYIFRIENAFGIFSRIYSDISVPLEEQDFYELVKANDISLRDAVVYSIFHLGHVPTLEEKEEGYKYLTELSISDRVYNSIHSITSRYEMVCDKDLVKRQHNVIGNNILLTNKRIILYADTKCARYCIEVFGSSSIEAIIDQDKSKEGFVRDGIPVYGIGTLEKLDFTKEIVLITNRRYEAIVKKLTSLGGVINQSFFVLNPEPDILDWNDDELTQFIEGELAKGESIYNEWRARYPVERFLLSPPKASGDIYVAGLYLKDYIKDYCPNGYKIFVSCNAASKVAALLGYETITLSQSNMDSMLLYIRYIGFDNTNSLNTNFCCLNRPLVQRINELHRIVDTNTAHQRLIFRSEDRHTCVELKQRNSETLFRENGLDKEKTILLAPYSYTFNNVPYEHSIELVQKLKKMGYEVCTNVAGDEQPIEGTKGLFISYDMLLDFANKCVGIIGIRSGLFDIISSSKSRMVVYYPKSLMTLYSLEGMGLKTEDILELSIDDNNWNEIVKDTIDYIRR